MFGPNKSTAESIHTFHEQVKKNEGVRWSDYQEIANIKKNAIPELKSYLQKNIDWSKNTEKNPDGTTRTPEEKAAGAQEWQKLLDSVNALEKAWKSSQLKIEKHKEENYEKVVAVTRAKLAELFGEVSGKTQTQDAQITQPANAAPVTTVTTPPRTPEKVTKDIEEFKRKSYSIDGKKVDFMKIDKINDRHEITLKIDNSTQQPFYLNQNTDKSWKAVEPTSNNYTVEFKDNEVTIKSKNPNTTEAAARADVTSRARTSTDSNSPSKKTEANPVQLILQKNKDYIKKNGVSSKNSDNITTDTYISTLLNNPTKEAVKKFQEENGYNNRFNKTPDGMIGANTKILIDEKLGKAQKIESNETKTESIMNIGREWIKRYALKRYNDNVFDIRTDNNVKPTQEKGILTFYVGGSNYAHILDGKASELSNWNNLSTADQHKIKEELTKEWKTRKDVSKTSQSNDLEKLQIKDTEHQSSLPYSNEGRNHGPTNLNYSNEGRNHGPTNLNYSNEGRNHGPTNLNYSNEGRNQ